MASIRASQQAALLRMLEPHAYGQDRTWHDPWKVLIYDAYCRDIISPLLKVGDLRKQGITLHLLLDTEREAVSDVPAIYFMQPTAANVKRLGEDCAKALYESYYINFTPAVPRPLLEELAAATLKSDSVSQISRVMDQYLNFASLEEDFFSLLLPNSYQRLNDPSTPDSLIESTIDQIVNGLFSAVVTLGAVPVIRYPATGGPAQMVAEQLGRRLHDQLRAHPQLFSEGQTSGFQRPLLVLCERSLDLSAMIQHAWSYCGLCHDLLDLKLNRVTIHEAASEGGEFGVEGPSKNALQHALHLLRLAHAATAAKGSRAWQRAGSEGRRAACCSYPCCCQPSALAASDGVHLPMFLSPQGPSGRRRTTSTRPTAFGRSTWVRLSRLWRRTSTQS